MLLDWVRRGGVGGNYNFNRISLYSASSDEEEELEEQQDNKSTDTSWSNLLLFLHPPLMVEISLDKRTADEKTKKAK